VATFVEATLPPGSIIQTPAALVFPFYGDRVVLANISTRGWCIPGGHIEGGESADQAVCREAIEEAGAVLDEVVYIGYFLLTERESGRMRHAPTFIASVQRLVEIPMGSESQGMQLAKGEDVAGLYFAWDELLSAVFEFAWQQKAVHLSSRHVPDLPLL
jgi:8-oxo-dGTP diphosphatase